MKGLKRDFLYNLILCDAYKYGTVSYKPSNIIEYTFVLPSDTKTLIQVFCWIYLDVFVCLCVFLISHALITLYTK